MNPHIFRLLSRHQQLDDALRIEQRRHWPDMVRLLRLRTLKQNLKDRLSRLMTQPRFASAPG